MFLASRVFVYLQCCALLVVASSKNVASSSEGTFSSKIDGASLSSEKDTPCSLRTEPYSGQLFSTETDIHVDLNPRGDFVPCLTVSTDAKVTIEINGELVEAIHDPSEGFYFSADALHRFFHTDPDDPCEVNDVCARCTARLAGVQESVDIVLYLQSAAEVVEPPKVALLPKEPYVGGVMSLTCTNRPICGVKAAKNTCEWFRVTDDNLEVMVEEPSCIFSGQYVVNRILTVSNLQRNDSAVYRCYCYDDKDLKASSDVAVTVRESARPHFVNTHSQEIRAIFLDDVTLNCPVEGFPEPAIQWFKDGVQLYLRSNWNYSLSDDGQSLRFKSYVTESAVSYTCRATNEFGEADLNFTILELCLLPHFSHISSSKLHVMLGQEVQLYCPAEGVPSPSIAWFKDGEPLNQTEKWLRFNSHVTTTSYLACEATNKLGSARLNFTVIVEPGVLQSPALVSLLACACVVALTLAVVLVIVCRVQDGKKAGLLAQVYSQWIEAVKKVHKNFVLSPSLPSQEQTDQMPFDRRRYELPPSHLKQDTYTLYDYPREQLDNITEDDGHYNIPNRPTEDSCDERSVLLPLVQPDAALRNGKGLSNYEEPMPGVVHPKNGDEKQKLSFA